MESPGRRAAGLWLGAFIALAGLLVFLYPDAHQQDGGYHFLFARWAWVHPELLVGVWARPAFTLIYSIPAQLGYPAAKIFTVLICATCAWQTWRLANDLGIARPSLAIPLLVLQPSFLLLSSETMTEPLFALLLVIAFRLHNSGRLVPGMLVASTLILARPEAVVLIPVWAIMVLLYRGDSRPAWRRIPSLLYLGAGAAAWWLAALAISGDPLFIANHWPYDWASPKGHYGSGPFWGYAARLPEVVGPMLVVPFVAGAVVLVARRRGLDLVFTMLSVLMFHSVLWTIGGFGSAGYPRYMASVAPSIALVTLIGWNEIADRFVAAPRWVKSAGVCFVLAASALFSILYVDGWIHSRDAHAVADSHAAISKEARPVQRIVWSQAYMAIRLDADPWTAPPWGDRSRNLKILAELPPKTLVFWDAETGPEWFHLTDADFARAGFQRLFSRSYVLTRRLRKSGWVGIDGPRRQEMHLLYRR